MKNLNHKICPKCNKVKNFKLFHKSTYTKTGYRSYCKVCEKISVHQYRLKNKDKYRLWNKNQRIRDKKTVHGFLNLIYNKMISRTRMPKEYYAWKYYAGIRVTFTRKWFVSKFTNNKKFLTLFNYWLANGQNRMDIPTIDRIDSDLNYSIENIQWLTHRDNSYKAVLLRKARIKC